MENEFLSETLQTLPSPWGLHQSIFNRILIHKLSQFGFFLKELDSKLCFQCKGGFEICINIVQLLSLDNISELVLFVPQIFLFDSAACENCALSFVIFTLGSWC